MRRRNLPIHLNLPIPLIFVLGVAAIFGGPALAAAQDSPFPQSVASGDPRPDSVVLWTRIAGPSDEDPKLATVEVATDEGFSAIEAQREVAGWGDYDYCVKVRITGLQPHTTYYYRFIYGDQVSPVGRTRTAPTPASDQPVRFAVAYGQDYIGHYYNSYLKLLLDHDEDIDFVVHLGDYVYETAGDPLFQDPSGERVIEFTDTAGAIALGDPSDPVYAASSLSNYRTLYRVDRSDPILRKVHERWPMIVIWDDHEFADDCWGAVATYHDGRSDELDPERRQRAEQAFLEWMPTEVGLDDNGDLAIDASVLYPNGGIYRDLRFGANLHLVLTDYRSFRPDHLIPEGAFPGTIAVDEATLETILGDSFPTLRGRFDPYVDLDRLGLGILRSTTTLIASQAYQLANPAFDVASAIAQARTSLRGPVSATYINALFAAAGLPAPFSGEVLAGLPRGLSYLYMGKQSLYSSTGSRYLVLNDTYNLLAAARYLGTDGAAQDVFGSDQQDWLINTLNTSSAIWKIFGSSVSMAPMVIDFTNPQISSLLPFEFPDVLRTRLKLNVDQWDGFPEKRREMLQNLAAVGNGVVISGDIHATFVSDHGNGVYEFTGPAISSKAFGSMVLSTVANDPTLSQVPGMETLVGHLPGMLQLSSLDDVLVSPSDIVYTDTFTDGYMVVEANAESITATMQEIPEEETATSYYDDPDALHGLFEATSFRIQDGQLTEVTSDAHIRQELREYFDQFAEHDFFSGSVLVAKDGYVLMKQGFGMANYEEGIPNRPSTVHAIASLTKAFAAMSIMMLEERGLLSVEDTVADYLPDFPNGDQIQIHHLLNHTSGLFDYTNNPLLFNSITAHHTPTQLLDYFINEPVSFAPGTDWEYCNSGYVMLGLILEQVSGLSFREFIAENILGPLAMTSTSYDPNGVDFPDKALGYDDITVDPPVGTMDFHTSIAYTAGAMCGTVEDLFKWDQALSTDALLSSETLQRMFTPGFGDYGYAWYIDDLDVNGEPHKQIWHWGAYFGFHSYIARLVDDNVTIIILRNTGPTAGTPDELRPMVTDVAGIVFGAQ